VTWFMSRRFAYYLDSGLVLLTFMSERTSKPAWNVVLRVLPVHTGVHTFASHLCVGRPDALGACDWFGIGYLSRQE